MDVTSQPIAVDLNEQAQLSKLNDDCLHALFGKLDLDDLSAIASTCIRFQSIARTVFKIEHARKCYDIAIIDTKQFTYQMPFIERYLSNFGDLITEINFHVKRSAELVQQQNAIWNLILEHSSCGTMQKLCMHNVLLIPEQINQSAAQSLFGHLKVLNIRNCGIHLMGILSASRKCTELSVIGHIETDYFTNNYPNLEKLVIECDTALSSIKQSDFNQFIVRHSHLKELKLHASNSIHIDFVQHLQRIECLTLGVSGGNLLFSLPDATQLQMVNLRQLIFNSYLYGVEEFLNRIAPASVDTLKHIKLTDCFLDGLFIHEICKFTNLEALEWCDIDVHYENIPNFNLLKNLDKLGLLTLKFLRNAEHFPIEEILQNVSSLLSIERLTVHGGHFNTETMEYLSRCTNLRELHLSDIQYSVDDFDWSSLRNLTKLNKFTVRGVEMAVNWLKHLTGSVDTLNHLGIANVEDTRLWDCICAYQNTNKLALDCTYDCISPDSIALIKEKFTKLKDLTLIFVSILRDQVVTGMQTIVKELDELTAFTLINLLNDENLLEFYDAEYFELIALQQRFNKKLIIKLIDGYNNPNHDFIEMFR